MPNRHSLILLELNELNFEYVEHYVRQGELPHLRRLIERHGYTCTASEQVYEHIEPWIQWVSVHTGKAYDEHGIFRLGDGAGAGMEQIWEALEKRGLKVGAFSPMNAENALSGPAFFVPDPWTPTQVTGSAVLKRLYAGVAQMVNDNARARITPHALFDLLIGFLAYGRMRNLARYVADVLRAPFAHWAKAIFLDRLLADCFIKLWRASRPDFASLFLNSAAHLQHHYLFNSSAYHGPHRNPDWYISPRSDPVLEIYRLYDRIVGDCLALDPQPRLMIATGLHQDPVDDPVYYWRLKDHASFLRMLGCTFTAVEPRMSRDFVVEFPGAHEATAAQAILLSGRNANGTPLFEVDNRGASLFVTLTYPHRIEPGFRAVFNSAVIDDLAREVVFVALKNAHHNGIGYLLDTGDTVPANRNETVPLTDIWRRVASAF